ncbi:glycosyltransferase family 39 protein [Bacillus cytotoxicus]|uniref:Glycosyltransferase RgtA/B/C/D-like domain-containing protein n=1 Tax=Bacillus cytotoxicus TaxID=580165 RepID=A0AAX2CND3_9BACI|nr:MULTISPECIES: glycosyltransferase family 39 protein [Bacillus cereus group]QTR71131.1 glycosyltransferase family 39 protein [Bacillus cytotoxicus]QTR83982.1 glycosyltransferase family 39 protein [Bacillus cytotoxicus]QTR87718.1 glycosyltransferase family 39 protein [Bacillus cytotoxicus]SCM07252.1 Uncharacterized protein BCB44BAC_04408 [Bacillus cytotoxicus]HDR4571252.1 glycosyltransferase family 39 protein [Bacillus cytotoxicus]
MNQIQTGFSSFFSKMIIGLLLVFYGYSWWSSFDAAKQFFGGSTTSMVIVFIIFVILLLLIASILQYRFTNQQFLIFLVSITILVRLGFVLFGDAPLIGDMKSMYESAKQVALGNRIGAVAQLPFILYQSLLIRIFGDTIFVLQLCNILFCTGTAFFIYRIASIVFQEECGRIAAVVYALYIPNILTSALLTAEPLATCLFYFACYILLHKGLSHSYMWIFSAILLAFSNMIHPVGIFLMIVVFVYVMLIEVFQASQKQSVLLKMIGLIVMFYVMHFGISYWMQTIGMPQYTISNKAYVQSVLIGERNNQQQEMKSSNIKEHIDQQLNEIEVERYAFLKPSIDQLSSEGMNFVLFKYEKLTYIVITLFTAIALLHLMIRKQKNEGYMLFILLIVGYIGMKLFHSNTVYENLILPGLFIVQSLGAYMSYFYCQKIFFKK